MNEQKQKQKQEQLQKVLQEHPEINDKLKAITADSQTEMIEKMIELLKEYGVELTAEDFKAPSGELKDDELAAVVGGGGCGCSGAGGGGGDGLVCACFIFGLGDLYTASKKALGAVIARGGLMSAGSCFCAGAGTGVTHWGDIDPYM